MTIRKAKAVGRPRVGKGKGKPLGQANNPSGAPKKAPAVDIRLRATIAQKEAIKSAAKSAGLTLSAYVLMRCELTSTT